MIILPGFIISIVAYIVGILATSFGVCVTCEEFNRKDFIGIFIGFLLTFCGITSIIIGYLVMI